ncbi:hypothetical protein [Algisphaera agarilytica]|uniref:DUF3311 domain-containing protein n=1 Tax=Algisphaera agarilytica TaxID=1385975 RepID=A0A7X0HC55_9BACT|nr:hypothetical protein [Algisphaera agarilytica]MBB6431709.1 hypothetical protein [Algisphaera agarilytica]
MKAKLLVTLFFVALIMGPGPGSMLIDGTSENPAAWLGVPALYLWTLLCFGVMAGCVVTAALTLWKTDDED